MGRAEWTGGEHSAPDPLATTSRIPHLGEEGRTVVFLIGAAIAAGSLVLALLVPNAPARGNESVRWTWWRSRPAA